MRRSLVFKLVAAFLVVSLLGAALTAILVRRMTQVEFEQLVMEQTLDNFITIVTDYYELNGSWQGIYAALQQAGMKPPLSDEGQMQPLNPPPQNDGARPVQSDPNPGASGVDVQVSVPVYFLVNVQGVVILPGQDHPVGTKISQSLLDGGELVEVDGELVGYVLPTGQLPKLGPREARYLERTDIAARNAALGAAVVALVLGAVLAQRLVKPLRQLTIAIRRMSAGELRQVVDVKSDDEVGELAQAFNQMSADLDHANRLRQQMTADIAHDLRSPLTVIGGYIESMQDGVLEATPQRLGVINSEVLHLQRLVEDLRTLSLADANELTLNRQLFSPVGLLERAYASYQHRAQQKNITLNLVCAAELVHVWMDEERLMQVLGNLLSNALRHTPSGGWVRLSGENKDGGVELLVEDSGGGIAEEDLPKIFERFYRGDRSRFQQSGESGLGLAIARSIVVLHGGRIHAESQAGSGALFRIWLPSAR